MKTVCIDEAFIRRQEAIEARMIRHACRDNIAPDFSRIGRRAYAEALDCALARPTKGGLHHIR